MEFTYKCYEKLLKTLERNDYQFTSYNSWEGKNKCVILRHDIDFDISRSLSIAKIERDRGVKSTFFVLLTTDFYNVFSRKSIYELHEILNCGHEVGLHFDEVRYYLNGKSQGDISKQIRQEAETLGSAIGCEIKVVSMHRPSKAVLDADIKIPGIINSYENDFVRKFKYLSDSRRKWREPVEDIIESEKYDKLHILTHPFWYNETDISLHDSVSSFIHCATMDRYMSMKDNITDINSIMSIDEV